MRTLFIGGFALMVIAQWYAPLSLIFKNNETLEYGEVYHFKTQPVDPSDPFRGKYVTLNFEAEHVTYKDTTLTFEPGEELFAILAKDSAGFTYVESVERYQPEDDRPFMNVKMRYVDVPGQAWIEFPFDRFYVEESKASEAEQLYWQNNRMQSESVCYAVVRVLDGNATLVDVMIDDKPILDIVRELNERTDD
jgi:uncharacterized membrane-anchored protein